MNAPSGSAKYILGIDLGTTNSVLAYTKIDSERPEIELLSIPQLVADNTIEARSSLPSFCFIANEGNGKLDLPWAEQRTFCVGEMARSKSAEFPERTIVAAKSWLSHGRVDLRAPIINKKKTEEVGKISPVDAAARYLGHLVAAWTAKHPVAPIADQQVVLTVPASFDAVAKELTREAAVAAGLPADTLLVEEPQAALYAWLSESSDQWRESLSVGDRLLVCDVGGGTTDLTLIAIRDQDGELELERLAVGNHLLVGGDNMDLALAHLAAGEFSKKGVKLDPWQSVSLWHSCRAAKETLLAEDGPENYTISVLGRGSKLIGGTVSISVDRAAVAQLLVDGFLPECKLSDKAIRQRASGFQELGLPFESDTGITRHVAEFLSSQANPDGDSACPTHVLFNGGVFKSVALQDRMLGVFDSWQEGSTKPLPGIQDLDHAVAKGAAHYGWLKEHGGMRIRGGVARSYYVGIETAGLAIPGAPRPLQALCVVPFGTEEGTDIDVASGEFGLVHGEQAEFRFFSSAVRKDDKAGDLLRSWDESEIFETSPLVATLPADDNVNDLTYR